MSDQSNNGNTPKVPPPPAARPDVEIVFTELRENQNPSPHKAGD